MSIATNALPTRQFTDESTEIVVNQNDDAGAIQAHRVPLEFLYDMGAQVANVKAYGASGSPITTSTTTSMVHGDVSVNLASPSSFRVGHGISIAGAGALGSIHVAKITALVGSLATIAPPIVTSVASGRTVKHDDTAAIQAAIDATASGLDIPLPALFAARLYFPGGIYRCTSTLNLGVHTSFIGSGSTQLTSDLDADQVTCLDFHDMFSGVGLAIAGNANQTRLQDFRLRGPNNGSSATTGITTNTAFYFELFNVTVFGWGTGCNYYNTRGRHIGVFIDHCFDDGLYLRECNEWTSIDSTYANCRNNIHIGGTTPANTHDLSFYDRLVDEGRGGASIQIDHGTNIAFNNVTVYASRPDGGGIGGYGIRLGDGTNVPSFVTLNNVHVRQYDLGSGSPLVVNNILIRGTDIRLVNVRTDIPTGGTSGNDIVDSGTRTVMLNVNGRYRLNLPTSTTGVATGELWANSGVVTVH